MTWIVAAFFVGVLAGSVFWWTLGAALLIDEIDDDEG